MDEDDDVPHLSAETFAALQEFYTEQEKREEIFEKLKTDGKLQEKIFFDENWQLSQFWYDDRTTEALVRVADKVVPDQGKALLISCPTLFVPMQRRFEDRCSVTLFEFDKRFDVYGSDFVHYDYNYPERIPCGLDKSYDLVIVDPPFLSEECLKKTLQSVQLLAKDKVILCTGTVMKDLAEEYFDLKICQFQPHHRKNLANEFSCFANFDLDSTLS